MPAANGMVPVNGRAQTSGLMAITGGPPPGTGLTPVQGPPGGSMGIKDRVLPARREAPPGRLARAVPVVLPGSAGASRSRRYH